ncbi:MAG: CvpA family protein [Pirellulales bacterium]
MWLFYLIAVPVFFATLAMMVREGLWSNTITLICIVLSGLAAFGFYQPLTVWVDEKTEGSYTYLLDIVCLWGVYVVAMILLSALAASLSKTRMRFKNPIDPIGGPIVAVISGWVLMSLVLASLHTAPLGKETMGGALVHSTSDVQSKSSLSAPDLWWLRFMQNAAQVDLLGTNQEFSAALFITTYADHREKFDKSQGWLQKRS